MKLNLLLQLFLLCIIGFCSTEMVGQAQVRCNENVRITFNGEESPIINCLDDDVEPVFRLRSKPLTMNFAYLVTDVEDQIIDVSTNNFLALESYGPGSFRVYSFSYYGNVTAQIGAKATESELADQCYGLSVNFLEVYNLSPDGGTVATETGASTVYTCPGDGNEDLVTFGTSVDNRFFVYVVTDDQNRIIQQLDGNVADFEQAGVGVCRVWGVAFVGDLNINPGDVITDVELASVCFSLSNTFVEVIRENPEGGTVSLTNGTKDATICVSGDDGLLAFQSSGTASTPYVFVVTDENNIILEILDGNTKDFSQTAPGTCRIWGVSYTGDLIANPGDNAASIALSDDCFDLSSDFVTVVRKAVSGGTVALDDGSSSVAVCVNDGAADLLNFNASNIGEGSYTFLITDANNTILAIPEGNSADFDGAGVGVCRVWGLAYSGNLLAQVGDDAAQVNLSDECFGLSNNFIEVERLEVQGGTIAFDDGSNAKRICSGDDSSDELNYTLSNNIGTNTSYLITDANNTILGITEESSFDFEGVPAGICRIWGVSYIGELTAELGLPADAIELADVCYALSTNFIEVTRIEVDGGTVALEDGTTETSVCTGTDQTAILTVNNTSSVPDASYAYLITNESDDFLAISESNVIDLSTAPSGNCKIYGFSYTGNIADINDLEDVRFVDLSDDCFDLSDNFIFVTREGVEGGIVSMPSGETERLVCIGDAEDDVVMFTNSDAAGAFYAYVITDENNIILGVTTVPEQDFGSAGAGVCRVWGLAYSGELLASEGDDAATVDLASECFDLSDNFITITRVEIDGGMVALSNGATETSICVDGDSNTLTATNTSSATASYVYLVTNENNGFLTSSSDGVIDLTGAPAGVCRIYGLSFTGEFTVTELVDVTTATLATECFALSENYITVSREDVQGGTVSIEGNSETEIEICVNDGRSDAITINSTGAIGESFVYVITDDNNTILQVSESNEVDFEEAGVGVCRVWGLSYTGNIIAEAGQVASDVQLTDDCFDLSDNFITVSRIEVDAGTLTLSDGSESTVVCVGDGNPDNISVSVLNASTDVNYAYLVTNELSELLEISESNEIDFEEAPVGNCLIFGVAYTGSLTVAPGDNITNSILSDDCFDLTDNAILVVRITVEGGTVATQDGATEVQICTGDNRPEVIQFDSTGVEGPSFAYVITDDQNIILGIKDSTDFEDFNNAPEGICRVWGLAYAGNLIAEAGQDAAAVPLSDDCFDLSDNFITIIRTVPRGGTISLLDGVTETNTCPGDGNADILEFTNENSSGDGYAYLITDEDNIVLAITEDSSFDFEAAGVGICRVWGLAFTGDLVVVPGDNAEISILSTDCAELSDNFITVTREAPAGGEISLLEGATSASICADDEPNVLEFELQGEVGSNFVFVILNITNINVLNTVVAITDSMSFDFNTLPEGAYSVTGVAFEGELNFGVGDNFNEVSQDLTTDCFSVSESAVIVTVTMPDAGNIIAPTDVLSLCTGDQNMDDDIVSFSSDSDAIAFLRYLLTNENDELIQVFEQSSLDFGALPSGEYRVRTISFTGEITLQPGDNVLTTSASTDCSDISDNFIAISNTMVDGGEIDSPEASNNQIFTCNDGNPDVIGFTNTSTAGADYIYILTDESGLILIELTGNEQDFDGTGFREVQVWGLSYTGNLNIASGELITDVQLSDGCFALSNNAISVFSDSPDGGSISSTNGETEITLCVEPDNASIGLSNNSESDLGYVYYLTDTANVVISFSLSDEVDFTDVTPGAYRIWGASYSGTLNDLTGQGADTAIISTSCFELSDNFISVIRESDVDGGLVTNINGDTLIYACPGAGGPDIVIVRTTSQDENYRLFITNGDGEVIVPDIGGNVIPFDGAAAGIYQIWGVSFNGTLDLDFGDNIFEDQLADSCFVLSRTNITVINELPDGGIVSTTDGETTVDVLVGDGVADSIFFMRETTSPNTLYTYVITNESNNILGYAESVQDFDMSAPGVYRVWGVAYTGDLTGQMGGVITAVEIADDCFDISDNFIQVNAASQEGFRVIDSNRGKESADGSVEDYFDLSIMPNPVSDNLTVRIVASNVESADSRIQIFNVAGELLEIYEMPTSVGRNELTIDVIDLPAGLYILNLTHGKQERTLRFAKQ